MGHLGTLKEHRQLISGKYCHLEDDKIQASEFENLKILISREFKVISADPTVEAHSQALDLLESLCYQYICLALFGDLNWRPEVGDIIALHAFIRENKIRVEHKLLVLTLLRRLESYDSLRSIQNESGEPTWEVIQRPPTRETIDSKIKHILTNLLKFPGAKPDVAFVNYIGPYLATVIRGKESGLNILFPPENSPNFALGAKQFYEKSVTMKYYKLIPTITGVTAHIQFLLNNGLNSTDNPIKILEIGGGTGGTTIPLFRSLSTQGFPLEYTFTDISNFFVGKTKSLISAEFPNMSVDYKLFDIEKRPEEQGIELGHYDIVIAADVFHATEFLGDTLSHTRATLKDGGLLILGEVFKSTMFLEISFGMSAGWWRWGDENRKHGSPLLLPTEWDAVLKENGFVDSFSIGHPFYGVVFASANSCQ